MIFSRDLLLINYHKKSTHDKKPVFFILNGEKLLVVLIVQYISKLFSHSFIRLNNVHGLNWLLGYA